MGEKKGEKVEVNFGNNSIEDVTWLCSLAESDLDLLISLKKLALKRASIIGHVQLAKKFDLKMLRALGFILVKSLEEKVKDLSLVPGMPESAAFLDRSNLLKCELDDDVMSIEELKECISFDASKEFCKRVLWSLFDTLLWLCFGLCRFIFLCKDRGRRMQCLEVVKDLDHHKIRKKRQKLMKKHNIKVEETVHVMTDEIDD
ncbi:Spc97/Spc98 [Corchorus capsularis]|uniref:Spc97/Spc98 n=1 Tax=Corchorus capsularis TaxID=210143 RepID=A0A1R3H9X3_COCAP|nr:Spc97/Spc98 [Corchorus capsularis]